MRYMVISLSLCMAASLVAGCAPGADEVKALEDYRMPTEVLAAPALTQTVEAVIVSRTPPKDCPVTLPDESVFEAPEPYSPAAPWEGISWFGADHLWTALHEDGVWWGLPLNSDGYTQKIMWWSSLYNLPAESEPALVVTGRRLDGEAPALRFYGATNAMADDIGDAMLTGVEFPTLGCWEVRGQYKLIMSLQDPRSGSRNDTDYSIALRSFRASFPKCAV